VSPHRPLLGAESLFELFNLGDRESTDWMRGGLCAQTDPELFFPDQSDPALPAKRICSGCPEREGCRDYAVVRPELVGIWGGTSERERRKLRRQAAGAGVPATVDRRVA
jgi:WhiB family transcriptional regulator, redox-sensing transcriptional regulator